MEHLTLDPQVPEHIRDLSCNVKSCVYNEDDRYCTAERINVGPAHALSGTETVCATYKKRR